VKVGDLLAEDHVLDKPLISHTIAFVSFTGMGPTSTQPWAEASMRWWLQYVPVAKLVMGIPAYSNDYSALPGHGGGNGTQAGVGPPSEVELQVGTTVETIWEFFDQIFTYMYTDQKGSPRIRYGTELNSTSAHLRTAMQLSIPAVGFWTMNSADEEMMGAVLDWATDRTALG
jgi:spore germination protein YaaH